MCTKVLSSKIQEGTYSWETTQWIFGPQVDTHSQKFGLIFDST